MENPTKEIRAFIVFDSAYGTECAIIVFTDSASRAKSCYTQNCCLAESEFTDLRVKREPSIDHYSTGEFEVIAYAASDRDKEIMLALGWEIFSDNYQYDDTM